MENKLDFKEAFSFLFKKEWSSIMLNIIGMLVLASALVIFSIYLITSVNRILGGIFCLFAIVYCIVLVLTLTGYFMLYAHDISYDKKTLPRELSFSRELFINGLKYIVMIIYKFPLFILIPFLIIAITGSLQKIFLGYCIYDIFILLINIPLVRIYTYFIKDMNVISLFRWGKAFQYTKGVKGAVWVVVVPYMATLILSSVVGFIIGLCIGAIFGDVSGILYDLPGKIGTKISVFICSIIYWNLLGQYAYNVNMKNSKSVSKEVSSKVSYDNNL